MAKADYDKGYKEAIEKIKEALNNKARIPERHYEMLHQ